MAKGWYNERPAVEGVVSVEPRLPFCNKGLVVHVQGVGGGLLETENQQQSKAMRQPAHPFYPFFLQKPVLPAAHLYEQ